MRRGLGLVLAVAVLTASLATEAQPTIVRIGYLAVGWGSGTAYLRPLETFRQRLRDLGWVEGTPHGAFPSSA